jgi:apolipoprotein N-acyltransferase
MIPFHRILITTGIVFCAGFAAWSLLRGQMALGIGFGVLGLGLTYYLRHLRRFIGR